jgi:hypothetical protein
MRLDADGALQLDMQEITPFFQYVFDKVFSVKKFYTYTYALIEQTYPILSV